MMLALKRIREHVNKNVAIILTLWMGKWENRFQSDKMSSFVKSNRRECACVSVKALYKCTELKCYSIEMFNIFSMQVNRCEWVSEHWSVRVCACMRVSTQHINIERVRVYVVC